MSVETILGKKDQGVLTCSERSPLLECVRLMNEKKIGALIATDKDGGVTGIITERDILHLIDEKWGMLGEVMVADIMTPWDELITTTADESVEKIMELMTDNHIRHLPVMDNDTPIGMISIGDVVKYQLEKAMVENESMKHYIGGV